jgi:hypothetical protein
MIQWLLSFKRSEQVYLLCYLFGLLSIIISIIFLQPIHLGQTVFFEEDFSIYDESVNSVYGEFSAEIKDNTLIEINFDITGENYSFSDTFTIYPQIMVINITINDLSNKQIYVNPANDTLRDMGLINHSYQSIQGKIVVPLPYEAIYDQVFKITIEIIYFIWEEYRFSIDPISFEGERTIKPSLLIGRYNSILQRNWNLVGLLFILAPIIIILRKKHQIVIEPPTYLSKKDNEVSWFFIAGNRLTHKGGDYLFWWSKRLNINQLIILVVGQILIMTILFHQYILHMANIQSIETNSEILLFLYQNKGLYLVILILLSLIQTLGPFLAYYIFSGDIKKTQRDVGIITYSSFIGFIIFIQLLLFSLFKLFNISMIVFNFILMTLILVYYLETSNKIYNDKINRSFQKSRKRATITTIVVKLSLLLISVAFIKFFLTTSISEFLLPL